MLLKLGVDTIGSDDNVAFHDQTIGERHPGHIAGLLKTAASVSGMHHFGRQGGG